MMWTWTGFVSSFLLVTVAEFGDKTFFLPLVLAMRHPRRLVFLGAWAALTGMTVLAVAIGRVLGLLPSQLVNVLSAGLFVFFGAKMLWQAWQMSPAVASKLEREEEEEALKWVEEVEAKGAGKGDWGVVTEAFGLTAVAEWGDKTQLATISLAAAHPGMSVIAGATLGHGLMITVAVIGGRMLATHISERTVHWIGGGLFLLFALLIAIEALAGIEI